MDVSVSAADAGARVVLFALRRREPEPAEVTSPFGPRERYDNTAERDSSWLEAWSLEVDRVRAEVGESDEDRLAAAYFAGRISVWQFEGLLDEVVLRRRRLPPESEWPSWHHGWLSEDALADAVAAFVGEHLRWPLVLCVAPDMEPVAARILAHVGSGRWKVRVYPDLPAGTWHLRG